MAVGFFQENGTVIVLAQQEVINLAAEFIDYKFGMVPTGDGAFIWSKDETVAPHGVRLTDEDRNPDSGRFFRLMKFYERRLCS